MSHDAIQRRSRWIIRIMEWDDARARYPNIFDEGMPRHVLALDRLGGRLRLGDLVAVYYPASRRHPERSERILGISRVAALRRAEQAGSCWIDLETAHRFDPPLKPDGAPSRVFLCCDLGWPAPDVQLFQSVFDAAVAAGFKPREEEADVAPASADTAAKRAEALPELEPGLRMFAGVEYSGDMRDPRQATWLSIVALDGDRLRVTRLEPTGRGGMQAYLRDPDRALMNVEAIGLAFPFGLPVAFAESLLGGSFPQQGWWALVKRLGQVSRPDFLIAAEEFRGAHGEVKRVTDDVARLDSPLHRERRDICPTSYHGIRMIGEDRSRYAIRPFENAQGKLLLEVRPEGVLRDLRRPDDASKGWQDVAARLDSLERWPVDVDARFRRSCTMRRAAFDAVLSARSAAVATLTGETEKTPEELSPEHADRVRHEGWIYGLQRGQT